MQHFLFEYHPVAPTTWVYLSSLMTIGLFFKFNRFWSVRNLDILMLLALSPGLLMIYFGYQSADAKVDTLVAEQVESTESPPDVEAAERTLTLGQQMNRRGYFWLVGCAGMWLVRLVLDSILRRRPLLTPNLTIGGLAFMGAALFVFLMANVVSSPGNARLDNLIDIHHANGPGYAVMNDLPVSAHKALAIFSHAAIVLGLVLIGHRHFGNAINGFGAAMLYLMLPYTSQMTGRLDHFLPAALLVWAVLFYRQPIVSGLFIGAASGCIYYPLFVIPLWFSYYWRRGWARFLVGVILALTAMSVGLLLTPSTSGFWGDLQRMLGLRVPLMTGLEGIWDETSGGWDPTYRIPALALFVVLSLGLVLWPAKKNLGTLISCTALVMVAAQFWMGWGGGLTIAWYLPLTLLTIFRPNLEDRVATSMLKPRPGEQEPAPQPA
jgi:hypothetical protein